MTHLLATSVLLPLLAAGDTTTNSISWAIVIFSVVLGLIVTLAPSRRSSEVKRPRKY
jgi:hypothetical protein